MRRKLRAVYQSSMFVLTNIGLGHKTVIPNNRNADINYSLIFAVISIYCLISSTKFFF